MKILFFNPEQYVDFENEPSNVQLRLPILNCGLPIDHRDHVYQRDLRAHGRTGMDRRALAAVADFRPDVVVYSATWEHENLSPWVLKAIRDGGTPVVSILWDSWIEPTTAEAELLANSTVLVVGDSLHTYLRCRMAGARLTPPAKVAFFGGQVFTDLVRPMPDEPKEYDVTLLGSNEGERSHLVAYLAAELPRRGIRFNKAGGLVDSSKGAFKLTDNWVSWEDYVRIINRSRLCLNSRTDPARQQIKGKIFDYMACGVACLTDANAEIHRFLPHGAVALFDGHEECLSQIVRLLGDDTERERIAAAGHHWFSEMFDFRGFWSDILKAALSVSQPVPSLPLLEEEYRSIASKSALLLRWNLKGAAQLIEFAFSTPSERVAALWLGRRGAFHRLGLDGGCIATNRMPIDILRVEGRLVITGSDFDRLEVAGEWRIGKNGAAARFENDLDRLNACIDAFKPPPRLSELWTDAPC